MTLHSTRLQKHDLERNQHRYYLLSVQLNLFGTCSLIREMGENRTPCAGRVIAPT
jgi:hypothetical protein